MTHNSIHRIVCIIPARFGSTRLPGKPLLKVKDKPLILWTYFRALSANVFDEVLVATDDHRIEEIVLKAGGKALMTGAQHTTGTDRINEVAQQIDCTHVVNLQGDEPLIPLDLLEEFVSTLKKIPKTSLLTCVSNATIEEVHNPDVVKAVLTRDNQALYFSRAPIPYNRDGDTGGQWYRHTGIYGFTQESLKAFCSYPPTPLEQTEKLEQLRALEMGMPIHCLVRDYDSPGIDTQEDLDAFKCRIEQESE